MMTAFLRNNLLFSVVICSGLLANSDNGYTEIECTIVPMNQAEGYSHLPVPGPQPSRVPAGQKATINWSGYVGATNTTTPTNYSVSAVSGSWIVPEVLPTGTDDYSSIWVGISDSATIEQIGTGHRSINNVQQNHAWFEMYPAVTHFINGFPLNIGDVISASVIYAGNNIFTMTLINETQKVTYTVPTSFTFSPTATREIAEWVVEAPSSTHILPLANFVTAYMWGCIATVNGVTAPIGNSSWQHLGIEMVTNTGIPKALTSALLPDDGSFFVTWQHQ